VNVFSENQAQTTSLEKTFSLTPKAFSGGDKRSPYWGLKEQFFGNGKSSKENWQSAFGRGDAV